MHLKMAQKQNSEGKTNEDDLKVVKLIEDLFMHVFPIHVPHLISLKVYRKLAPFKFISS